MEILVAGNFTDSADFDPGPGTLQMVSEGSFDMYIQKLNPDGSLAWVKQIGGPTTIDPSGLEIDNAGNIYVTGRYSDSVDFDPGPGTAILVSNWTHDAFLLKLDAAGNFQWVRSTEGTTGYVAIGHDIAFDQQGNIVVVGSHAGLIDLDPGPGLDTISTGGSISHNLFLWKFDANGNYLSGYGFGDGGSLSISKVDIDSDNNLYLGGRFEGNPDVDPGSGVVNMPSHGLWDGFILKLDSAGTYQWGHPIGGSANDFVTEIELDPQGDLWFSGNFVDQIDLDPGPGMHTITSSPASISNYFIAKVDGAANLLYGASTFKGLNSSMALDALGNVYFVGYFRGNTDFDPGPNVVPISTASSDPNTIVIRLAPNGDFQWGRVIGTRDLRAGYPQSLDVGPGGKVVFSGYYNGPADFDPGPGVFLLDWESGTDGYISQWQTDSCGSFWMTLDSMRPVPCIGTGYLSFAELINNPNYTFQWDEFPSLQVPYATITTPGIYHFEVSRPDGCSQRYAIHVNGPPQPTGFDIRTTMVPGLFRPGIETDIHPAAYNDGCQPISGDLMIVYDSLVNPQTLTPPPTQVSGDTLIWNYSNLTWDNSPFAPRVTLRTDNNAPIGGMICLDAFSPIQQGDLNHSNNSYQQCLSVVNSWDPNDKRVFPQGICDDHFVGTTQSLTYSLRFQNTGTAPAIDVVLYDTIDQWLDINSLRITSQSHPGLVASIVQDSILKLAYIGINLPDSNANFESSQGFVQVEFDPLPGIPDMTRVENRVAIYFDYNLPVITNTVFNTFSGQPPLDLGINRVGQALVSSTNGAAYQWIDCATQTNIPGATQQSFTPSGDGLYAVEVSIPGCSGISDCHSYQVVAAEEETKDLSALVTLYPNPGHGPFFIESDKSIKNVRLQVLDAMGRQLLEKEVHNLTHIELQFEAPAGFYLLRIISPEGAGTIRFRKE